MPRSSAPWALVADEPSLEVVEAASHRFAVIAPQCLAFDELVEHLSRQLETLMPWASAIAWSLSRVSSDTRTCMATAGRPVCFRRLATAGEGGDETTGRFGAVCGVRGGVRSREV